MIDRIQFNASASPQEGIKRPQKSALSYTIFTLTMSTDSQNPLLTPAERFLEVLQALTRKLDLLHRHIDPALRPRIENSEPNGEYKEANCAQLRTFLANAERELGFAAVLRATGMLKLDVLPDPQGLRLETSLALMAVSEEELRGTVVWVKAVLAKWEET